jgi:hypothetical protein
MPRRQADDQDCSDCCRTDENRHQQLAAAACGGSQQLAPMPDHADIPQYGSAGSANAPATQVADRYDSPVSDLFHRKAGLTIAGSARRSGKIPGG